ncbi:hypothetical protein VFPPC_18494 [Pochonia chlamydosporia 170]|uniref:Uncharacterized protein n=1 Tax=Pochonia chlamydosporia 170 TaxID=1380566 RepID=A0A219ANQ4_METCM|nr:hypothetical protein VFPPC_18494 [Pochonia chlamydosporia 170]OWT42383.1 hypothetical protein VFPPC_18494 [Pochonia chlamydosporia 170]
MHSVIFFSLMACALVASRRVSSGQDVRLYGGARDGRVLNLGLQGKYEAAEREYERCKNIGERNLLLAIRLLATYLQSC